MVRLPFRLQSNYRRAKRLLVRRYERGVDIMPPTTREIFLANRVDGVPFSVIAAERGMTLDEIGEHIGVALRCLAAVVDGPDPWWWRLWPLR